MVILGSHRGPVFDHHDQGSFAGAIDPGAPWLDTLRDLHCRRAPEDICIVSRLLGHTELRTSEEHYNYASALSAQRRHLARIARLRGADEDEVAPLAIDLGD